MQQPKAFIQQAMPVLKASLYALKAAAAVGRAFGFLLPQEFGALEDLVSLPTKVAVCARFKLDLDADPSLSLNVLQRIYEECSSNPTAPADSYSNSLRHQVSRTSMSLSLAPSSSVTEKDKLKTGAANLTDVNYDSILQLLDQYNPKWRQTGKLLV